jgi:hypothetical protein
MNKIEANDGEAVGARISERTHQVTNRPKRGASRQAQVLTVLYGAEAMNRRRFFGLFGGASAALALPISNAGLLDGPEAGASTEIVDLRTNSDRTPEPKFPTGSYTPFGYLDNPNHSAVLNRSGIIRSVPPLGFGFWARSMPWPYGIGAMREVNYLSFLHLSAVINGKAFHSTEDFDRSGVHLESRYHTKNIMSYDWSFNDLELRLQYIYSSPQGIHFETGRLPCQDSIISLIDIKNRGTSACPVTLHASNIYGFPQEAWWGSDGVSATFVESPDAALSKIWAYGDVFCVRSDRKASSKKATADEHQWRQWIERDDLSSNRGASASFPGAMYTMQSYSVTLQPRGEYQTTISLSRGVNQDAALQESERSVQKSRSVYFSKLREDNEFYASTPLLTGDWQDSWKRGWIYDLETLRMTIRPALGIYKHSWDGMQIFTPRAVLGETLLDSLTLSYCDINLAKDVILGMFADAQAPNLPCSREDGSVNMICSDGSEAGTAPTWGMPFHVIRSIYSRDGDRGWIRELYPHMKNFLDWWLSNRTDSDGWFHCKCSWESGQDGSKRFIVAEGNPAAVSDFVRTVDIEAAMADAFLSMELFAEIADKPQDRERWKTLAEKRVSSTRSMYVDGWFRDFDARANKPIILRDYYDVMMLYPVAAGLATDEQMKAIAPRFKYFAENPTFWLEWPSFMLPFSEAAWNSGQRDLLSEVLAKTANRAYARTDARRSKPISVDESAPEHPNRMTGKMPAQYCYRAPGVANEFWPIDDSNPGGCENYGWGATLPALLIRNIIGFREKSNSASNQFDLTPTFPAHMRTAGKTYGVTNLAYLGCRISIDYTVQDGESLKISIVARSESNKLPVTVKHEDGKQLARFSREGNSVQCEVTIKHGDSCAVSFA